MAQGIEHIPTDESRKLVEELSGYGLNHDNIAALIGGGIARVTLADHYRQELDAGKAKANVKVGKRIFDKAIEGDTTAMIWWSKTQMGWKEAKNEEVKEEKNNFSFQIHLTKDD